MKVAALVAASAVLLLSTTSLSLADQRYASKSGTAVGSSCGANSNTADATSGPCTTISQAYANAKTAGGGSARVFVISNGTFQENLTLDYTGGPTEIRTSGDVHPGVGSVSGVAVTVDTGANDVRIFDIRIVGNSGLTTNGIDVNSVNTLELHRVEMRGFAGLAINFVPNTGTNTAFYVFDSDIANSTTGCILIKPAGSTGATTVIKNSQIHHSTGYGVRTDSSATTSSNPIKTTLVGSAVTNVANSAVVSLSTGASFARTIVEGSQLLNANNGAVANGTNAQVALNNSLVSGNTTGLASFGGGQFFSFGNNAISFNGSNGTAPIQITPQ